MELLTDEKRREAIQGLIDFFKTERGEEVGMVAAGAILDRILKDAGIAIYNKGIGDALRLMKERVDSLELDVSSLVKE